MPPIQISKSCMPFFPSSTRPPERDKKQISTFHFLFIPNSRATSTVHLWNFRRQSISSAIGREQPFRTLSEFDPFWIWRNMASRNQNRPPRSPAVSRLYSMFLFYFFRIARKWVNGTSFLHQCLVIKGLLIICIIFIAELRTKSKLESVVPRETFWIFSFMRCLGLKLFLLWSSKWLSFKALEFDFVLYYSRHDRFLKQSSRKRMFQTIFP